MRATSSIAALVISGPAISSCATDSPDTGSGTSMNRQGTSAAESACMAAVNRNYGGKEKGLRVISSEFSQAGSLVMVAADGDRWRCLASNDVAVEDLSIASGNR